MEASKKLDMFVESGIAKQHIFIPLLFPSVNEYSRQASQTGGRPGKRVTMANFNKQSMENKVQWFIKAQQLEPMGQAYFFFTYRELHRQRNKDNVCALAKKFIFDAMQKAQIIRNDGWKEIVGWNESFECVRTDSGVEVRMYDPFLAEAYIIDETYKAITRELAAYKKFRQRTSR